MLPADIYRYGMRYPPPGSAWIQFGDKELDRAMSAISHDIQKTLHQKKESTKALHQDKLQKLGLAPMQAIEPRTQFFSIADQPPVEEVTPDEPVQQEEESTTTQISEPGPSRLQQAGRFVQNHAWPFTRDILAPATADLAGSLTSAGVYLTKKAAWNLADVLFAIGGAEGGEEGGEEAPQTASYAMLGDGEDPAQEQRIHELASKGKGWLIEQIYTKPGWMEMFGVADERGYRGSQTAEFRKKLGGMSNHELAKVLIALS